MVMIDDDGRPDHRTKNADNEDWREEDVRYVPQLLVQLNDVMVVTQSGVPSDTTHGLIDLSDQIESTTHTPCTRTT